MKRTVNHRLLAQGLSVIMILLISLCGTPFTLPVEAALGGNVYTDGNFETQTSPVYVGHSATANITDTQHQGLTGTKSLQVTMEGDYSGISLPVNLTPGKQYWFSFWIKFQSGSFQQTHVNYRRNPGQPNQSEGDAYMFDKWGNTDWRQINSVFTYTGNLGDTPALLIYCASKNTFYLDNMTIKEYTPFNYLENQVLNGDFEDNTAMLFAGGGSDISFSSENVYSGSSALLVHQRGGWGNMQYGVYIKQGATYFVSCKAKLLGDNISTTLQYNLAYGDADDNSHILQNPTLLNSSSGYTEAKGFITVPTGVNVKNARISAYANPADGNAVDFLMDDLVFYEIPSFSLVSSSPLDNSVTTTDAPVILNFSNDLDITSATNASSYQLNGLSSNIGTFTMPTTKSVSVAFKNYLVEKQTYTFSANLKDAYGQAISLTITFDTKAVGKPAILNTTPANKAYNVANKNTVMLVNFDSNVETSTITSGNIKVNGDTTLIKRIDILSASQFKIVFNDLALSTLYNVSFSNITGITGIAMDDKTVSFFTTADELIMYKDFETDAGLYDSVSDISTGTRDTTTAANGSSSLRLDASGAYGWIGYSPSMELNKLYELSFYGKSGQAYSEIVPAIHEQSDNPFYGIPNGNLKELVPGAANFIKKTVTFKITGQIVKIYFYGESAGAGSFYIDDLKLSKIGATTLIPFGSPSNNETNVPIDQKITLVFNHSIDAATLAGNIKINGLTNLVANAAVVSNEPNKVEITLANELQCDTKYEITADNVKDTYGQIIPSVKTTFTTVAKYSINDFKLYKDYSTNPVEITSAGLSAGDVTAIINSADNFSNTDGSIAVILALYKGSNLVKAQFNKSSITAKGSLTAPLITTMTIPDLSDGNYYLKAFLWENMENARPIFDSRKITE